jgi:formylglycine-generating enzyme required for sulfatase activity
MVSLLPGLAASAGACLFTLEDVVAPGAGAASGAGAGAAAGPDATLDGSAAEGSVDAVLAEPETGLPVDGDTGSGGSPSDAGGPSCASLPVACGPSGAGTCCASAFVTGGSFLRSYDAVTYNDKNNPAVVADFRLDLYEVTVARLRAFVKAYPASRPAAGAGAHPLVAGSGWQDAWAPSLPKDKASFVSALACNGKYQTFTEAPGPNETRPANCLTWFEAFAFCAWDGGRLPTEAEWNYAAAGGAEQRAYPWSSPPTATAIDESRASYFVDDTRMCFGDGAIGCSLADLVSAGSKPAGDGRWGHAEMAGNAMEWVLDWHSPAYPIPCNNCANLVPGDNRVLRGGGLDVKAPYLLASYRFPAPPTSRFYYYGVRCARSP